MKQEKGFVLAFSLLISSIVLALAFGIFNILLKQIVLTSTAANSQVSFYAADAGAECALYWDTHNSRPPGPPAYDLNDEYIYDYKGVFALNGNYPDTQLSPNPYTPQVNFTCGSSLIGLTHTTEGGNSFSFEIDGGKCAKLTVEKIYKDFDTFDTKIESLGYNVPCADIERGGKKIVERAIRVQY